MKVMGQHTYMGGMMLGCMQAGWTPMGSAETWKEPAALSAYLGIKRVDLSDAVQPADVVIGNPPCSRFSPMSFSAFKKGERESLHAFCDLTDVLDLGIRTRARLIWWENGPLAFSSGRNLIEQAAEYVGAKQTIVLKFSMPVTGSLQNRTRTHVFHLVDDRMTPDLIQMPVSDYQEMPVYPWAMRGLDETTVKPYVHESYYPMANPRATVAKEWDPNRTKMGFISQKPAMVREQQRYSPNILGGRYFAWEDRNRWLSVAEYANISCFPSDVNWVEKFGMAGHRIITCMSKGVSPSVSEWLASKFVPQLFGQRVYPVQMYAPKAETINSVTYIRVPSIGKAKDIIW